jgi:hypothetical protein
MTYLNPSPVAPKWSGKRWQELIVAAGPALLTLVLATAAVLLGWRGVDQAAQIYRVLEIRTHGLMLWDSGWYGGNYPLGYSILFPALAAVLGTYTLAVASAVIAVWAFDQVVRQHFGTRPLGTWYFAISTLLPVTIGQWPFLAGEAAGLCALVALQRGKRPLAVTLGLLSALFSPLAAAFLAMGCLAWAVHARGRRGWMIATAAATLAVVLGAGVLFPGTGSFPFTWTALLATELLCLTALTPLVRTTPVVRVGALLYAVGSLLSYWVPNPLGGNAQRLAAAVGVPLLACFVTAPGPAFERLSHAGIVRRFVPETVQLRDYRWRAAAVALLIPFAVWQWAPGRGVVTSSGSAPWTQESYYQPLIQELAQVAPNPVRVEVVPTLEHWESAFVAQHVPLARGWERQLDIADNAIFYTPGALGPTSYQDWLFQNGVSYVALPSAPLDYAANAEGALLRSGQVPGLTLVWANARWTMWRVQGSPGLVTGAATLTALEPDHLTIDAYKAGDITVRVRYTTFWSVTSGNACVSQDPTKLQSPAPARPTSAGKTSPPPAAPIGWTHIDATTPGIIQLSATVLHPSKPVSCP